MPFDFDLDSISNGVLVTTAFLGAFAAALWLSLIIWTYRDMRARSQDPLAPILAALVVGVLSVAGLAVYLILRPPKTLDEAYQHTLEEEALLREIEAASVCPGCGRHTRPDWQVCPHCQTRLKKPCQGCGRLMELAWNLCPYCATPAPGKRLEAHPVPVGHEVSG